MSISAELGEIREVGLDQGTIRYRERGSGPVILFVHGVLVNGDLWRKVVPLLADDFRCIAPDWPLGAHEMALDPDADASPRGVAAMVAEFIETVGLDDVTLVGNDTGGAICQLVIARHPERIGRLVLTNCDAYENFLPALIRPLQWAARLPGFGRLLALTMRWLPTRRQVFWTLSNSAMDRQVTDAAVGPLASNPAVRRDAVTFLKRISAADTQAAAEAFGGFQRPVLLAWGADDRLYFSRKYAERLAHDFPNSRLEYVDHSRTFVPEDQPRKLAELIRGFLLETKSA